MIDVQNLHDHRNIPLHKVGIKNLRYPVTVLDRNHRTQSTVATVELYANLPHHYKGTHMSRFVEVFNSHADNIEMPNFLHMLDEVRRRLEAERAFGSVQFPYFIEKSAPISGQKSMMDYFCTFSGTVAEKHREFFVSIRVPVTTLCPCSKEISDRGAHNQRGFCTVTVQVDEFFWMEEIISLVESAASCDLHTLLKREDEKYVTERAYDDPVFVEDLVREVCILLEDRYSFPWFSVEATNMESIHNHDAYAYVERGVKPGEPPCN